MTIKVNGEGQTLTLATPKPLNRSSPKFAQVITSGISTTLQNLIQIGYGILFLRMRDFVHQNVYSAIFWGVQEITYSQDAPTNFDAKYDKRRDSWQGCTFLGSWNQNLTFTPPFSKKPPILGPILYLEIFSQKQL